MRKSTRIKILNIQIDKLNDKKYEKDHKWTIQTLTYINRFFGVDSHQSKYIKDFNFDGYIPHDATKDDIENNRIERIESVKRFLDDCIELIKNNGVNFPKTNFLEQLNNQSLIAILIFAIPGLLYVGYLFGTSTTDSKNVILRQENVMLQKENQRLNDSLSIMRTPTYNTDNVTK